jgi:hypothetical protein
MDSACSLDNWKQQRVDKLGPNDLIVFGQKHRSWKVVSNVSVNQRKNRLSLVPMDPLMEREVGPAIKQVAHKGASVWLFRPKQQLQSQ